MGELEIAAMDGSQASVYVAGGVEIADVVHALGAELAAAGWIWTFDWTGFAQAGSKRADLLQELGGGSVSGGMRKLGQLEEDGVRRAHLVVIVLPGGIGTGTELGLALALRKPVIVIGGGGRFDLCPFLHLGSVSWWRGWTASDPRSLAAGIGAWWSEHLADRRARGER
jgi:hypothetical protein